MTNWRLALTAGTLLACVGGSTAHAYCPGGDTCPSYSSSLEVFEICNNVSTTTCVGTYSVNFNDTISLTKLRSTSGSALAACIYSGGSWSMHRLRAVSTNTMITWSSMQKDMAFCSGAGDDVIFVAKVGDTTCGGALVTDWGYNGYQLEIWGSNGADTLTGGYHSDMLCGGSGNDVLLDGRQGNDDVDGYSGNDTLEGYQGADFVWGYTGADIVRDASDYGDYLFGEDDADPCVADQVPGPAGSSRINCATAGGSDNSSSDVTWNLLANTEYCESRNTTCTVW